jgi:hypothetical protein
MNAFLVDLALAEADARAVMESFAGGFPVPADVAERVRLRSEVKTAELRRKVGVVNVAVDLIREGRDEA